MEIIDQYRILICLQLYFIMEVFKWK